MSAVELKPDAHAIPIPTPCIGVCKIEAASGWCLGCGRSGEEIAAWQNAAPDFKRRVWSCLPRRRASLSLKVYRLPWSPDDIASMIERTLRRRWGHWTLGVEAASASFAIGPYDDAEIVRTSDAVAAITHKGALRLKAHEKTIALAFGNAANPQGPQAICLVLPRGRLSLRRGEGLTCIGPDEGAIRLSDRRAHLYDLGLGDELAARLCLRSQDAELNARLDAVSRQPWSAALNGDVMPGGRADIVVETGLGRCEIFGAPPSAEPARTVAPLDEDRIRSKRELPPGWDLAPVFAPCALFYPASSKPLGAFVDELA